LNGPARVATFEAVSRRLPRTRSFSLIEQEDPGMPVPGSVRVSQAELALPWLAVSAVLAASTCIG